MTKKKHIYIYIIIRHLAAKPTRPGTEVNCHWPFVTELKL